MLQVQGVGFIVSMSPFSAALLLKATPPTVPLSPCPAIRFLCFTNSNHSIHLYIFSQIRKWGRPFIWQHNYQCQGKGGGKKTWPGMVKGCRCLF